MICAVSAWRDNQPESFWQNLLPYYQRLVAWLQELRLDFICPPSDWGETAIPPEQNLPVVEAWQKILAAGKGRGIYFVYRLSEGWQLLSLANRTGDYLSSWVSAILQALSWLHERGILSYQLSPWTILCRQHGERWQLALLQVGVVLPGHLAFPCSRFTAPEISQGEGDQRSDLFMLGATCYWLVTGEMPCESDKTLALRRHKLADGWSEIINSLLSPCPQERFADAAEVMNALHKLANVPSEWELPSHRLPLRVPFFSSPIFHQLAAAITSLSTPDAAPDQIACWLVGGAGTGKSTWLAQLQKLCRAHRITCLSYTLVSSNSCLTPFWQLFSQKTSGETVHECYRSAADLMSHLLSPDAETYLHTREQAIRQIGQGMQPCVLLLDNLHLASAETLDLLEALLKETGLRMLQKKSRSASRSGRSPSWFIVIGTALSGEYPLWQQFLQRIGESYLLKGYVSTCDIAEEPPCSDLVSHLLGVKEAPQIFTDKLSKLCRHNPQHVRHILAMLLRQGRLYRQDSGWYVEAASLAELELPETLPAAAAAHVELLSPATRRLLLLFALTGDALSWRFILQADAGGDVVAALWELYGDGCLNIEEDGRLYLANASLWETVPAAAEDLSPAVSLPTDRWPLAEMLAWLRLTLAQKEPDWRHQFWRIVWSEMRRAGLLSVWRRWCKEFLPAAGSERFFHSATAWEEKVYAVEIATLLEQETISFWGKLAKHAPQREIAIGRLAASYLTLGKLTEAGRQLKNLKACLTGASPLLLKAWYHYLHAQVQYRQQKNDEACSHAGESLSSLATLLAQEPHEALLALYYQWLDNDLCREASRQYGEWLYAGLAMAQKFPASSLLAKAYYLLAVFARKHGDYAAARDALHKSLSLAQEFCCPWHETLSLMEMAAVYTELGCADKADNYLIQTLTLCERYALPGCLGEAYLLRGQCSLNQAPKEESLAWYRSALHMLRQHNQESLQVAALCQLSEALCLDQQKTAMNHYEEARHLLLSAGYPRLSIELTITQAVLANASGQVVNIAALHQAINDAVSYGYRPLLWRLFYHRGGVYRLMGEMGKALQDFAQSWRVITEIAEKLPEAMREIYLHSPPCRMVYDIWVSLTTALPDRPDAAITVANSELSGTNMDQPTFLPKTAALYQQDMANQRLQELREENSSLRKLLDINKKLTTEHDLGNLLGFIMDTAIEITSAERGFLILATTVQEKLFEVARNFEGEDIANPQFEVSHSITEKVVRTGAAILSTDALEDERFDGYRSVSELKLHSVLAVPLKVKKSTIGALYLDNRFEKAVFSEKDKNMLEAFADQAALAIENARLIGDKERKQEELAQSQRQVAILNDELALLNAKLAIKVERQEEELSEVKYILHHDRQEWQNKYQYGNIVATSAPMQEIFHILDRVTDKNIPVLIYGESGTGKELIAKAIHFNGPRKEQKFLSENCAALNDSLLETELFGHMKGAFTGAYADKKGLFELADGGSLFLDEIADMSSNMQAALLRVLENNVIRRVGGKDTIPIDVRVISASNKDLKQLVAKGVFREDLLFRLKVVQINLPPLRQRQADIPLLLDHFLREYAQETSSDMRRLDKKAMQMLVNYDWPGNVRELRNVLYNVLSLNDEAELSAAHFHDLLLATADKSDVFGEEMSIDEYARRFIVAYQGKYNDSQLSRILGFSRKTLWEKRKKWSIFRNPEAKEKG